jgi:type I pantothenate kinase
MSTDSRRPGLSTFTRDQWRDLARGNEWTNNPVELPSGLIPTAAQDLVDAYAPLCSLVVQMLQSRRRLGITPAGPSGPEVTKSPFLIGITGGVAAGKSVCATVLQALLEAVKAKPGPLRVSLLCTDSFLFPNALLEERGLLQTKGFPDTYDLDRLLDAIVAIRSGGSKIEVPVYSHATYDVVKGAHQAIERPDVLIVEGLNVLQPSPKPGARGGLEIADLLDTSVYVDASEADMARWFAERLLALRSLVPEDPSPFLRWFNSLSVSEAETVVERTWSEVNLPNLRLHVAPTRTRAKFVLRCDARHRVTEVTMRTV